ncbi:MAG: hypothetical protein JKX94_04910 [Sneathiella sp.]|nr:hypothetical protein [Sneathiella sp.]
MADNELEKRANELLKGKTVEKIMLRGKEEVMLVFQDGTTLYVNIDENCLDLSITGP